MSSTSFHVHSENIIDSTKKKIIPYLHFINLFGFFPWLGGGKWTMTSCDLNEQTYVHWVGNSKYMMSQIMTSLSNMSVGNNSLWVYLKTIKLLHECFRLKKG